MAKTIKQIADELGVSKTAVNKKIENLGLRSSLRKIGNQFAIDETNESLIKSAFLGNKSQTENRKPVCEKSETSLQLVFDLVSMLQKELEMKNEQILSLQEENRKLSREILELSGKISDTLQNITKTQLADKLIEGKDMLEQEDFQKKKRWQFWK